MDRIGRLLVERSGRVLVVTGVITLVAIAMLFRLRVNADVTQFLTSGNERGEAWVALQDKYDTADPINVLVSVPEGKTISDKDVLIELVQLRDRLTALDDVAHVGSIIPAVNPLTGAAITPEMINAVPEAMIARFLSQNPVADLLVSDDGRHTLMVVVPSGDPVRVARELTGIKPPEGLKVNYSGNPVIFATVLDMIGWFLLFIPPAVIILLLLTFFANIGDRKLTILSIIPALLGALWTFGLIFGLGLEVDIVSVLVPIYVIVMGSADGLHFVTHYQEASERTEDPVARVTSTLRQVGVPMILTTISTAAGFLSLLVTGVRPIQQLGLFTAIGIGLAGVVSFFFLPALLSRLDIEPKHHTAILGPRVTAAIKALARPRWIAAVLSVGLIAFSAVFIPRLQVDSDQLFFIKENHPLRQSFNETAEIFGGATPLIGEFVYDPNGGPEQLTHLETLERDFERLPGVRTVFSAADLAGKIPPAEMDAVLAGTAALPLGRMASQDGLRFIVFPGPFETKDLRAWLDFADTHAEIRVLTGMPVLWDEIARLVIRAQIGSLIAAYVLVALMLLIAYRKVRQTLVALAPLVLTTGTLLGFIAASGIQLNLVTAIASSIVIGVGIDYSIHFVAAIDYARPAGDGYILRAIDSAGRPIVANALGIALALSALWLSPLKIHPEISMIMWVSMTTAAVTALVVIPALLPAAGMREPAPNSNP
ncbi:MAG: RND family transporter [Actinobacteria bacterium]|nr:RND family transporter [Actinomycetota bacterium]